MTPERYQQIEQLYHAALELDTSQRAAFLDRACVGDEGLRQEVESLIASHEQTWDFMSAPAVEVAARALAEEQSGSAAGRRIGPYRVIREIGHGGMGAVYLAARDDEQYQKQVAIKLIKRGLDSDLIVRRFRHERQILASLDHPNIAKLLDGGTTEDGLPYFVMDYVEGLPLTEYCDTRKLSTVERLGLFRAVCSAVHYAHQNLVVHRDLKPSNILVTAEGAPKLLDFGIAKLISPDPSSDTTETITALRVMTPEYASPEQARGESVTTISDVYSLGVLLYELLTGHRPYRFKSRSPAEIARVICEEEPERPSTAVSRVEEVTSCDSQATTAPPRGAVSETRADKPAKRHRRLSGDLDNIVLMAMRKEPQRRYASAEQFSEDIRRYLAGLPVIARKDTLSYRASKFIKRNKAGVAAAALIVLALLGGIVATNWEARRAKAQQAKAERRFNDVRKLANSLLFEIHDGIVNLPGSTPTRELLVKRALEYLDNLAQEASDDPSLQRELATAYQKVGDVQGNPSFANRGDAAGALKSYRKALAIRQALLVSDPMSAEIRYDLSTTYNKIGDALWTTGNTAKSLESYRRALDIRQGLMAQHPADEKTRRSVAITLLNLGDALRQTGSTVQALESYRRALEIFESLTARDPTNERARRDLLVSYNKLGHALMTTGDLAGALENYRKALAITEAVVAQDPTSALARNDLGIGYDNVSKALAASGDLTGALASYRKTYAIFEALAVADPTNAEARRNLADIYERTGEVLARAADLTGALEHHRQALQIRESLVEQNSTNAQFRRDLALSDQNIGDVLAPTNRAGALKGYQQALAIFQALFAQDPTNTEARSDLAAIRQRIGDLSVRMGDSAKALQSYQEALQLLEALSTQDPTNADVRFNLAQSYSKLGGVHVMLASPVTAPVGQRREHWRQARSWYQKSLDLWLDLRHRGTLNGPDADQPDRVTGEIARCDAALAKLQR